MRLFGIGTKALSINQVLDRIETISQAKSGVSVTPENCERSPTVKAIVNAISRRIAVSPVKVYQRGKQNGRDTKTELPKHPVSLLMGRPNEWQTRTSYWLDMASQLVRYNNCYSWIGRGRTGPARRLVPLQAGQTAAKLDDMQLTYTAAIGDKPAEEYPPDVIFHARGAARDFLNGDSPVLDVKEAIGMEIAAEEFGATFYANGAVPMLVFQLMQGFKEWKSEEEKDQFVQSVKEKLAGGNRHSAFLLPKGVELGDKNKYSFDLANAQFVDARKYQRTVIAGAFGVPPHLVGDLERATFNNVEQQDSDFTINVVLPYVRMIESALERDLLTEEDRTEGRIIRFNLDAIQRADFKSQQEGLQIMRLNGTINANEWREMRGLNPIAEDEGGEGYWMPSNYQLPGEDPDEAKEDDDDTDNSSALRGEDAQDAPN